jgi:F-type H+-transporting ATPase subunit delta
MVLPDVVRQPGGWEPAFPAAPGRLSAVGIGTRSGLWSDRSAVWGVSATTGESRFLDLPDALEELGVVAAVRSTGSDVARLEDEIFAVGRLVQANPDLRDALSDPARSRDDKSALISGLLGDKVLPATVALVRQSLSGSHRTVTVALASYQKVAAEVRGQGVATVRVAQPLGQHERDRLAAALARTYGREVHLNVIVDPEVIGGIRVEIGDDVIDGTVSSRLDEAGRRLAG